MNTLAHRHHLFHVPDAVAFRNAAVALIVLDDGRYLMQLRDDKPGIFYPDHWGLFGGAVDEGEEPEAALRRELMEELLLEVTSVSYFTRMDFDFSCVGIGPLYRMFYEVPLAGVQASDLQLHEGRRVEALDLSDILLRKRIAPYDSFAVWLHYAHCQRGGYG